MGIAFEIGPVKVAWYGLMIMLGATAGVFIAAREARRRGESVDHLFNMLLIVLPLGIVGARLYHVIDQWDFYMRDPRLIIGGQGLGIFGAVIGGAAGLIIYAKRKKLNTLRWMDILAPGLILAQAIGRWGNFFNQELYGYPTDLPWAIYIDPAHRLPGYEDFARFHPLFLYESLLNALGCAFLLVVARKWSNRLLDGDVFLLYLVYYGVVRFLLEGLKIDVWMIGGIPTARLITAAAIAAAVVLSVYRHRRTQAPPPDSS